MVTKNLLAVMIQLSEKDEIITLKDVQEQNIYFIHLNEDSRYSSCFKEMIFFENSNYSFQTLPKYFISYIEN